MRALAHLVVAMVIVPLAIAPLVLVALAQLGNPLTGERPCRLATARLDPARLYTARLCTARLCTARLDPSRLDLPVRGHRATSCRRTGVFHLSACRCRSLWPGCGGSLCRPDGRLLPALLLVRLVLLRLLDLSVAVMPARLARLGGCTEPGSEQSTERGGQQGAMARGAIAEGGGHGELLDSWQARPLAVGAVHVKVD
jgi:hypothetical protein